MTQPSSAPNPEQFVGASIPTPPVADDDGSTSPELLATLAALAVGSGTGSAVLASLAQTRVLVPVVAMLDEVETGPTGLAHEKHSSMAAVLVETADGQRALLAFSGTDSLARWRPDARPVALMAPLAARAALSERADTLVVDVAGPTPFAVAGAELLMLAAVARPSGDPTKDPVLRAAVAAELRITGWVETASLVAPEEPSAPATLLVGGSAASGDLVVLVQRLAGDRVVQHLLPGGVRVRQVAPDDVGDTPERCFP